MKSKGFAATIALIIAGILAPAQAEVIIDQSRISISSPRAPGLDNVIWRSHKVDLLNY